MRTYCFLQTVAEEHSIPYSELKKAVLDVFTRDQQNDLDPDGDFLENTEHFECFVREHEIKEVNIGAVVLYLKGVDLAVTHQINYNLMIDLDKIQNQKIGLIQGAFFITSLALAAFSYLL